MQNRVFLLLIIQLFSVFAFAQKTAFFQLKGNELGSNTVYDLCVLDNGNIVAATDHGVAIISVGGVKMLTHKKALRNSYTAIQLDAMNRVYALNFRNQLYRIGRDSLELVLDLTQDFSERVLGYHFWESTILVYSSRSCKRYNLNTGKPLEHWNNTIARQILRNDSLRFAILETDSDSSFLFGNTLLCGDTLVLKSNINSTSSGARYYQKDSLLFTLRTGLGIVEISPTKQIIACKPYLEGAKLNHMGHTKDHFWVASPNGLLLFDPALNDSIPSLILEGYSVSCARQDLQGNYWIGTLSNGIFIVPSVNISYIKSPLLTDGDFASTLAIPEKDSILVATKTGRIFSVNSSNQMDLIIDAPVVELFDIQIDGGDLYIAGGAKLFKLSNGKITQLKSHGVNKNILLIDDFVLGYSWYNTSIMSKYTEKDSTHNLPVFPYLKPDELHKNHIGKEPFQQLWANREGTKLVGANMGRCKRVTVDRLSYLDSLNGQPFKVIDIATSKTNQGYVLTANGTVYQIDSISLSLIPIAQFNCNSLPERLCINNGNLIVYDNGELLLIKEGDNKQYRFRDLVPFNSNDLIELTITPNFVWITFLNGIFKIPLSAFEKETQPIVQSLSLKGFSSEQEFYSLSADPGPIRVMINYYDVLSMGQLKYRYKLNNDDWIQMDRITDELVLSNLAAGDYDLIVQVQRGTSIVNERYLRFSIAPYLYETTWFILLLIVAVFCGTVLFFRIRIRALKKREMINQKLKQAQLTALKAQMNPHFLFNVLNSIQTMVLKEDKIKANKIMSELSVLVRKILNYSNKEFIPLEAELEVLQNYLKLEKHRFSDEFTFELKIDNSVEDYLNWHIPPMLIQPFIENAINHGLLHKKQDRILILSFSVEEKSLRCKVEDNGIGRKRAAELKLKSKKHKSFASNASKDRITLLKEAGHFQANIEIEDLYHQNGHSAGTCVHIRLPLILTT